MTRRSQWINYQARDDRAGFIPSPDQIKAACAKIQESWTEADFIARRLGITLGKSGLQNAETLSDMRERQNSNPIPGVDCHLEHTEAVHDL